MELKKETKTQETEDKKNFMKPAFNDPLAKRENFAVSLRKKKTQQAIHEKRRKLAENMKNNNLQADGDEGTNIE